MICVLEELVNEGKEAYGNVHFLEASKRAPEGGFLDMLFVRD